MDFQANNIRRIKIILFLTTSIVFVVCKSNPGEKKSEGTDRKDRSDWINKYYQTSEMAGNSGLKDLKILIGKTSYWTDFGFDSPDEINICRIGRGIPGLFLMYEELIGSETINLDKPHTIIFPILVGNIVKTTIRVTNTEQGWYINDMGDRNYVDVINKIIKDSLYNSKIVLIYDYIFIENLKNDTIYMLDIEGHPEIGSQKDSLIKQEDLLKNIKVYINNLK